MTRKKSDEPALCPRCPRRPYLGLVKARSYTRTPTTESALKLCIKLRSLKLSDAIKCPHYPNTESIANYILGRKKKMRVSYKPKWKRK